MTRSASIVTFALPDESRPFVKTLAPGASVLHQGPAPLLPTLVGHCGEKCLAVVHTGVGDTPAGRLRLKTMLATAEGMAWVISAGYAGGLSPDLRVGDLVLGKNHSEPGLLTAARLLLEDEPPRVGALVTRRHRRGNRRRQSPRSTPPPARWPWTWKPRGSPTPAPRGRAAAVAACHQRRRRAIVPGAERRPVRCRAPTSALPRAATVAAGCIPGGSHRLRRSCAV